MVFACQKDSFLKEFSSTVVSCTPSEINKVENGKKTTIPGYEVVMEDTILFPEGGGQPCDHGHLNSIPVLQVLRRGNEAVHFVESSLPVGEKVVQTIDWERRLDHMQQHSGQHLITAMALQLYGFKTTAWWLGEEETYIELDTPEMSKEQLIEIERIVNEKIRESIPVKVDEYETGAPILNEIRGGLPKDHVGKVRVVTIETIESDMCCGTHVTNLSQLQMIKLLGVEKGKKGKVNLHFLAGNRVLKRMTCLLQKEEAITSLLNNGPEKHLDIIEKLFRTQRQSLKNLQNLLKTIAVTEAQKLKQTQPRPKFFGLHKKEAEVDFIMTFIREVGDTESLLFLTVGDDKAGHMVLYGNEKYISALGQEVCSLLEGKGNGKGNKFQAKISNLKKIPKAEELILEKMKTIDIN